MNKQWRIVEEVFFEGVACRACDYLHTWHENHGPGLSEPMAECKLLESNDPDHAKCPGFIDQQEKTQCAG